VVSEYRLSPAAKADINGIWDYTAETWSAAQANTYIRGLVKSLEMLVTFPEMASERQETIPPVRVHRHQSHLIIYRIEADHIAVIRILHYRRYWPALLDE
jgi:toxin ParE1/3/4